MLFGSAGGVLCLLLILITFTNVAHEKNLLMKQALIQGYWVARSLEAAYSMMTHEHAAAMRRLLQEIAVDPSLRFLAIVDQQQRIVVASTPTMEGTVWAEPLGEPREKGHMVRQEAARLDLVFPAFFAETLQAMRHHHIEHDSALDQARWIVMELEMTEAYAHYRHTITQSVLVSLSVGVLGIVAFLFLGTIQKYRLAHASMTQLAAIQRHLAHFVPRTVQRLIAENPEQPRFEKVACEATVLFLDVEQYTLLSTQVSPEQLNHLIEQYFAACLDIILAHDGEINETAGDGVMAIFAGRTPATHALNAVRAATAIRQQVTRLNGEYPPQSPEIRINMGLNTGSVLLGATMLKGTTGEHFTYTASGMVTNIAARLCDLGQQGEIHLNETTARLVQQHVPLTGPRHERVKHVAEMLSVYQLT
jgi:class 3 adenylate cyclase